MIIDRDEIRQHDMRSGRTGEAFGHHRMASQHSSLKHLFLSEETLPPGRKSSSPHYHTHKEEVVYVVKGHPTIIEGGSRSKAKPGDFVVFPADTKAPHQIVNETDEDCVFVVSAAGFERDETVYC